MMLPSVRSLVESFSAYGQRPAVGLRAEFGLRWWSYERLGDEAWRMAGVLRDRGVRPGQHIVLWASNCPEWVACLLGAALRGVVVLTVDEGSSPGSVRQLVEQFSAVLVIHGVAQHVSTFGIDTRSIHATNPGPTSLGDLGVSVPADNPAVILSTSGTSSQPKRVVLTHRNLLSQLETFRRWRYLTRAVPVRMLSLSPLSHAQGLVLGIFIPLSLGLSTIYSHSVNAEHVIRTIRQNRVSLLVAVPRVQHLLIRALRARPSGRGGGDVGALAQATRSFLLRRHRLFLATHAVLGYRFWVVIVGGAALASEDERFWFDAGYVLAQGYGLTETAAIVTVNVNTPFFGHQGAIGRAVGPQTVRVSDDGEILVRGPNVAPEPLGDSTGREDVFLDPEGFLHTGDLARRDARGRLYFEGRKKEVIVTGEGHNVSPRTVEAVLHRMPEVRDAVVVGSVREGYEEVHAVLLTRAGTDAALIVRHANAALEPHEAIRSWTVWPGEDFPRTSLLKVKREEVAAAVQRGRIAPAATDAAPSIDALRQAHDRSERVRLIARYLMHTPRQERTAFHLRLVDDLGLRSLDVVELLTLLEAAGERPLDDVPVAADATLGDLAGLDRAGPAQRSSRLPVRAPRWSRGMAGRLLRSLVRPAVIGLWARLCTRLTARLTDDGLDVRPPFIIAAAPHRHWLDAFAIYAALPRRLRGRLFVVTNQNADAYFAPRADTPRRARLVSGLWYYVLAPLVFDFTIVPSFGLTRQGLSETGRLLDRGYCPITFPKGLFFDARDQQRHDPGIALLAIQAQVAILPVWLDGNDALRPRPAYARPPITVRFGEPLATAPDMSAADVTRALDAVFQKLA